MALSHELISQFAKIVKDDKKQSSESTVYGTVVTDGDGNKYVKLDGSDQLTPLSDNERPSADSTTTSANVGERVSVLIKNHTATVTGNISSPAVRTGDFNDLNDEVTDIKQFDILIADKVQANEGYIKALQADKAEVGDLTAATARITELETKKASIEELNAAKAEITDLKTTKIDADVANAKFATIENLDATNATVDGLSATHAAFETATTNKFTAVDADITDLETKKLSAEEAEIKHANINFTNITNAAVEKLFTESGIIKDLVVSEGHITGELVGVTIKGDLIEGGTVKADKLVILGENGLYYKLNVNSLGETTASSDPKYQNGLDGSVIIAKSITAEKVMVDDLVAFGATIGGINISNSALYSGVKSSADNTTKGFYLDKDGQLVVGDASNFLKYYKDENGNYKLAISAASISFGSNNKNIETAINEISESAETNANDLANYITSTNASLEDLQGQIDGSIMTWFYEYEPTDTNEPASEWTTTALKNNHLGDLFYNTITGYCYRWQVQNNNYSWGRITDVDVTKALADAAAAQTTANNKRRVFVTTPTPPYDIGDLWAQGSDGELMRCKIAKTDNQSYASADWEKASKYTDDTAANAAQADADALKTRVTTAETAIEQNTEAIVLRATKTEVTEEISKVQVGGRNLYIGSKDFSGDLWVNKDSWSVESEKYKDFTVLSRGYQWMGVSQHIATEKGELYTISFFAKGTATSDLTSIHRNATLDNDTGLKIISGNFEIYNYWWTPSSDATEWKRYWATLEIIADDVTLAWRLENSSSTGTVYICGLKLEKGNKPTDWTPAPEDVDADTTAKVDRVQVGGRNLLVGTSNPVTHTGTGSTNQVTNLYNTSKYFRDITDFNGKTFTLSFDWETTATSGTFLVQLNGTPWWDMCKKVTVSSSNNSGRSVFTFGSDSNLSTGNYNGIQLRSDNLTGTITIKNAMFEAGNKPGSWQPAPEDVDNDINDTASDLQTLMDEKDNSVLDSSRQNLDKALENYVPLNEYDQYKTTTESKLEQTSKDITANFKTTTESIENLNGTMQSKFTELSKYIRFSINGIEIGEDKNTLKLTLDNNMIRFEKNGDTIGWWDGIDFHTGNIMVDVSERAQFGNFAFIPRSDGSLMFLKVDNTIGGNLFNINDCEFESNIISYVPIGTTGAHVHITQSTLSSVHFTLDATKTYRITYISENALINGYDSSSIPWVKKFEQQGDGMQTITVTGAAEYYFSALEVGDYTFKDVKIVEVS